MGTLRRSKGKSGYWLARWKDSAGKWRQQTTCTSDKTAAGRKLAALELEAIRTEVCGEEYIHRDTKLEDIVELWLTNHRPPVWTRGSFESILCRWRKRILPEIGGFEATFGNVTRQVTENAHRRWLDRKLSPASVNALVTSGKMFFEWALKQGYCTENPFKGIAKVFVPPRVPAPLLGSKIEKVIQNVRNPLVQRAALVAYDTGLRVSEVCRIEWEDVDVAKGLLKVVSEAGRGITKSKKERIVPLTQRAIRVLKEVHVKRGQRPGPLLGAIWHVYGEALTAAQKEVGVSHFRWHDLRHYALTRFVELGAGYHELQAIAGWVDLKMATRYIHVGQKNLVDLKNKMDTVIQSGGNAHKCEPPTL